MILKSFEVKNFRSIASLTRCEVEEDITVLAGKNESGKSNLLHALMAFGLGKFTDLDISGDSNDPSTVIVSFSITRDEVEQIAQEAFQIKSTDEFAFESKLQKPVYEVVFKRMSSVEGISVSGSAITALEKLQKGELKYWTADLEQAIRELKKVEITGMQREKIEGIKSGNDTSKLLQLAAELILALKPYSDLPEDFAKLRADIEDYRNNVEFYSKDFEFKAQLWDLAPRFILFDSFEDILPDEANESEVGSSDIIKRFFTVAGVEPEQIFSEANCRKRKTIVDRISSQITGDFCGYYQQSEVKIQLDVDGPKIQFYIKDGNIPIPFFPGQRSKGFQWFLSFYLTLNSAGSNQNLIILIDEPGLYLHPKAQQEVLQVLENLAIQNQVIFTTHSPYLIDNEQLSRIRLVLRETEGGSTIVENKIQKVADKDTLTPIVTAIGYSFGQGLSISKSLNIVTEGISDAYYLRAFMQLYRFKMEQDVGDIGVIGAVGASQVPNVVSILLGWGVRFLALFDNDKEGRKFHAKLVKKLGLSDGKDVIFVSPTKEEAIEDLFSKSDFHQYVLLDSSEITDESIKNSEIAGERKAVLAKKFYELVCAKRGLKLSLDTEGNILRLMNDLNLLQTDNADVMS